MTKTKARKEFKFENIVYKLVEKHDRTIDIGLLADIGKQHRKLISQNTKEVLETVSNELYTNGAITIDGLNRIRDSLTKGK